MTNNEGKCIQLQIDLPYTNSLLYNSQKYRINFDLLKYSSKYFFERRNEILENEDIDLTTYDPDDNISNFSPDEVIDFINYIQTNPIQLTNNNIVTLQYFGHKYDINQLITSTEEYINEHEEEIILKFLKRKELLKTVDLSFYEDKISANFPIYVNNDDILSLDINTLYRILEKVRINNDKELKTSSTKNFLLKVLDKYGRPASILFKFADIDALDDETLSLLLTKYSKVFEFEFIAASILNAFLTMKKEHAKYEEESNNKYESIAKELKEQKNNNDETNAILERERQEHIKYKEESSNKYESILKELQEQKNNNDKTNAILERERQEHAKYEEESSNQYESILKELQEQKKNNDEMNTTLKRERQEHIKYEEESSNKYESIFKELQEQKNNNDKTNAILERERQEHMKYKEESNKKYESILKELQEQKNNNDEMNTTLKRERQEHIKYKEESNNKYESILKELQEQKNNNDEMNTTLERERQEHIKYKEESNNKYESILKELQEQKNNNDEMNKHLLKCKEENEQLLEKQKDERNEHDELIKELDKLKKQTISMRDPKNDHNEKHGEYNCEGTISICEYGKNMIISNNADIEKVNNLLKYLIKEKNKHKKKSELS